MFKIGDGVLSPVEPVTANAIIPAATGLAWLADVLARINDHKITDLAALLPWRWAAARESRKLAA